MKSYISCFKFKYDEAESYNLFFYEYFIYLVGTINQWNQIKFYNWATCFKIK